MNPNLIQSAIKSALTQNWNEAVRINSLLLETEAEDVESMNRLAYAYIKLGNLDLAKETYKKVLKIDKYNPIATKNLQRLETLTKADLHQEFASLPTPSVFLEEPGKTKIVTLVHPASAKLLCNLMTAQKTNVVVKKRAIEIRNGKGEYIGALPDDLSHRLRILMEAGNTYDAYVKNVKKTEVTIFIREVKRCKKYAQFPSFALNHQTQYFNSTSFKDGGIDEEE